MRLIILIDYWRDRDNNGICAYRRAIINSLASEGEFETLLILVRTPEAQKAEQQKDQYPSNVSCIYTEFDVTEDDMVCQNGRRLAEMLTQQIKARGYQSAVLHLNWMNHSPFGTLMKQLCGINVIMTKHCVRWRRMMLTDYPLCYKLEKEVVGHAALSGLSRTLAATLRKCFDNADRVITVTNDAANVVSGLYGIDRDKVSVIPNGIALAQSVTSRDEARKRFGFSASECIMLYIGSIQEAKGLEVLAALADSLAGRLKQFRLVVCGAGQFDNFLTGLPDRLMSRVTMMGNVDRKTLAYLHCAADFGIVPSLHEQCSYAALEMMAAGLPTFGSCIPGLSELFAPDDPLLIPFIYAPDGLHIDLQPAIDTMMRLLDDPAFRQQCVARQTERIARYFTLDNMIQKTMEVYRDLTRPTVA